MPNTKKTVTEEQKSENSDFYKTQLIKLSAFFGGILAFFLVLVLFVFISRSSWRDSLRDKTNQILRQNDVALTAGSWCRVSSDITSQFSVYEAESSSGRKGMYAVICRVTTVYGPLCAVFVYDSVSALADFVDYADIPPLIKDAVLETTEKNQIQFWEEKIPLILKNIQTEGKNEK